MSMKPKLETMVMLVAGAIAGVLFTLALVAWWAKSPSFLELRLVEILRLVIEVFLALGVAYLVHRVTAKKAKRQEIIAELITSLQASIREWQRSGVAYMEAPNETDSRTVTRASKTVAIELNWLVDVAEEAGIREVADYRTELEGLYYKYKSGITGGAFGAANASYHQRDIATCDATYRDFMRNLYDRKVSLYC